MEILASYRLVAVLLVAAAVCQRADALCKGGDSCCNDGKCGYREGDCDDEDDCAGGFYCGNANCYGYDFEEPSDTFPDDCCEYEKRGKISTKTVNDIFELCSGCSLLCPGCKPPCSGLTVSTTAATFPIST